MQSCRGMRMESIMGGMASSMLVLIEWVDLVFLIWLLGCEGDR
jgi:hypothetical protein